MLDWLNQFGGKPDHPWRDAQAANEDLAALSEGVSVDLKFTDLLLAAAGSSRTAAQHSRV